ncbi:hypothetical protein ACFLVS_02795 [Chloroflexota bacterium]
MSIIADLIRYSRLAFGLRGFLHGPINLEESHRVIAERLRNREKNFLRLIQRGIYQNPKSPYLKLLQIAGCEFGDIESGVNQEGIEATLQKLLAAEVYISWEEFKGRREVVREGRHFQFSEREFDNPFLPVYYQSQSSGSRSLGTRTIFDLSHLLAGSYYILPMLAVNNVLDVPLGIWQPILPAISGTHSVLTHWKVGKPIARWFSPVDKRQIQSPLQHQLAMRYIIYGSRLWGARLAEPEYVGLEEAIKVAQWMADTKKQFGGCCLICSPSRAVKVCQAAIENGLDIQGTHFTVGGEPLTLAKRQQIEAAGASVTTRYAISEIGRIGFGCLKSDSTDDVHLFHDSVALIQHRRKVRPAGIQVNTFLFTTLLPSAPKILLNMESDDYGVVETHECGCLFGQMGFNTHIYDIRSFAKLTGSGMSIVGTDLVHILEKVLPREYGGAATDYQLLEEEDRRGQTHLSLIISPTIGAVDDDDVITTLLTELRRGPHPGKLAAGVWAQANTIQVKRMYPISKMGKVMTLHLMKK